MPTYRCGECGESFFERSRLAELSPCQLCGADGEVTLETDDPPPPAPAERKVDPRSAPREAAAALLAECGITAPPVDVEEIARRLGAPVSYVALGTVDGELRDGRILVNHALHRVRRRYTIAHEIGHMRLHGTPDRSGGEIEREAQVFAGSLLVPPPFLAAVVAENLGFGAIRGRFDVSRDALSIALAQARLSGRVTAP